MKSLLVISVSVLLTTCGSPKLVSTPVDTKVSEIQTSQSIVENKEAKKTIEKTTISSNMEFTNAEKIGVLMEYLASDELKGRDSGSEGIEKAAVFIEEYLKASGVDPYYKNYRDTLTNFEPTSYNVVGVLEGSDPNLKDEFILIGAHYDHIGIITAVDGDNIGNGANDNASGTAAIMEIARYFGERRSNKRSLIFAWFSAEEKGLLGSKHLAKRLKHEELNLYAMLNYEMVGVPLKDKNYFMYVTGYEMSNLAEISNGYASENLIGFLPTAKTYGLYQRSDNYPFAEEFDIPSHTFCTFDFTNFNFYHKPGDEVEVIDLKHMAEVVNKSIPVVEGIANSISQELRMK